MLNIRMVKQIKHFYNLKSFDLLIKSGEINQSLDLWKIKI